VKHLVAFSIASTSGQRLARGDRIEETAMKAMLSPLDPSAQTLVAKACDIIIGITDGNASTTSCSARVLMLASGEK
jgi:hypothetical protein